MTFCNFSCEEKESFYQAVLDDIKLTNESLAASLKEVNGGRLRTSAKLFFQIYCSLISFYDPEDNEPLRNFFVKYYEDNPAFAQLFYENFDAIYVSYLVCVLLPGVNSHTVSLLLYYT